MDRFNETASRSSESSNESNEGFETVWSIYLEYAQKEDHRVASDWQELDTVLIFAGLFSAIVSAFLVEVRKGLQEDLLLETTMLLRQLINAVDSTAPQYQPSYLPSKPSQEWVTVLWYASLSSSLVAAVGAMLGKTWVRTYNTTKTRSLNPKKASLCRQSRYNAARTWHFSTVLSCIPLLLHAALFQFLVGLLILLWNDNRIVAILVTALSGLATFFYLSSTLIPLRYPYFPFRTPATTILQRILQSTMIEDIVRRLYHFGKECTNRPSSRTPGCSFPSSLGVCGGYVIVCIADGLALFYLGLTYLLFRIPGKVLPKPKEPSLQVLEADTLAWLLEAAEDIAHIEIVIDAVSRLQLQALTESDLTKLSVFDKIGAYFSSITVRGGNNGELIIPKPGTSDSTLRAVFKALDTISTLFVYDSREMIILEHQEKSLLHLIDTFCRFRHSPVQGASLYAVANMIKLLRSFNQDMGGKKAIMIRVKDYASFIVRDPGIHPFETVRQTLSWSTPLTPEVANTCVDAFLSILRMQHLDGAEILTLLNALYERIHIDYHETPPIVLPQSVPQALIRLLVDVPSTPTLVDRPIVVKAVLNVAAYYQRIKTMTELEFQLPPIASWHALRLVSEETAVLCASLDACGDALVALQSIHLGMKMGWMISDLHTIKCRILVPVLISRMSQYDPAIHEKPHKAPVAVPRFIEAIREGLDDSNEELISICSRHVPDWIKSMRNKLATWTVSDENGSDISTLQDWVTNLGHLYAFWYDLRRFSMSGSSENLLSPATDVLIPLLKRADVVQATVKALRQVIRCFPTQEAAAFLKAGGCDLLASHISTADNNLTKELVEIVDTILETVQFDSNNPEHIRELRPIWNEMKVVHQLSGWNELIRKWGLQGEGENRQGFDE